MLKNNKIVYDLFYINITRLFFLIIDRSCKRPTQTTFLLTTHMPLSCTRFMKDMSALKLYTYVQRFQTNCTFGPWHGSMRYEHQTICLCTNGLQVLDIRSCTNVVHSTCNRHSDLIIQII